MSITRLISYCIDSNVFIIKNGEHCLIVDCAVGLDKVKEAIGSAKVDGILLTHGHYDHSIFCDDYAKAFNAKIYANENIKQTLSNSEANYSEGQFEMQDFSNFVFIKDDCKLKISEFDVECFSSPGHSKCSECYLIDDNLFAGDVLFENGIGRTDLIGSDKQEMFNTLCKLEKIGFKNVFSGHGGQSDDIIQSKNIAIFKRFLSR